MIIYHLLHIRSRVKRSIHMFCFGGGVKLKNVLLLQHCWSHHLECWTHSTQAVTKPAFWKNTTSALLWNGNKNRNLMITCGWLKPRSVLLTESCIILLWSNILGRNKEKEETQISLRNWLPNFSLHSNGLLFPKVCYIHQMVSLLGTNWNHIICHNFSPNFQQDWRPNVIRCVTGKKSLGTPLPAEEAATEPHFPKQLFSGRM